MSRVILFDFLLNHIEQILRNNDGHPALNNDIRIFIFTDIASAGEHPPDRSTVKGISFTGQDAVTCEISADIRICASVEAHFKGMENVRSDLWIDLISAIRSDLVSDRRCGACRPALLRCVVHPASDFPRELFGVILSPALHESLQKNPLWSFRNILCSISDIDAEILQLLLINDGVVFAAAEAVGSVDNNSVKFIGLCVADHTLKLRTAICPAGDMPVGIDIDQLHLILFYVSFTLPDLAFDRLVCLAGPGRVSRIDNSPFHDYISGLTHTSRRLGFFIFVTEQKAFDNTESLATIIFIELPKGDKQSGFIIG